jgi:phosphohistidine swiveling domain-containing protein
MVNPKKPIEQWGPIDAVILYMSFWFHNVGPGITKKWDVSWPELLAYFKDRRITYYWERASMQREGENALRAWLIPKSKFKKIHNEYLKTWKGCLSLEKWIDINLNDVHDKNGLASLVQQTYECFTDFWNVSLIFEESNYAAPRYMEKRLKGKIPPQNMANALEVLLTPEKLSFHQQEELELFKLYVKAKNKKQLDVLLGRHTKKWHWVDNSYLGCKHLKPRDFSKRLKGISRSWAKSKIQNIEQYGKNTLKKKQQLVKRFKLGAHMLELAQLISYSIWWQDDRKAKTWQAHSFIEKLAKKTSTLYSMPLKDLALYNAEEFFNLHTYGRKLSPLALKNRLAHTVINTTPRRYTMKSDKRSKSMIKPFLLLNTKSVTTNIITGTVVSKGKGSVTGKIKIILSPHNGEKIRPGDILVAPMTSPDYVPLMRQAKAILTDFGGLMSHAAVISRELNIPCIVNTKIATQILKDGDRVTINTESGIITKL